MHLALAVVISAALGWLATPHSVKNQGAPLAAASQLTGTLIPPGQPTAPEQTRPQAAAEAVPAGVPDRSGPDRSSNCGSIEA